MTIHLLFVTVTIHKHQTTNEELEDRKRIKTITDDMMDRKFEFYNLY
ncbi:YrzI family small protein [Bacillus marinisedimentorum]|nr:YrzI family small protein [Bacillus marinisedimentorum]